MIIHLCSAIDTKGKPWLNPKDGATSAIKHPAGQLNSLHLAAKPSLSLSLFKFIFLVNLVVPPLRFKIFL